MFFKFDKVKILITCFLIIIKVKEIFSSKISKIVIVATWVFSILLSLPMIKITEFLPYSDKNQTVNQCYLAITKPYYIYMISYTSIIIFVPTVFLAFLYMKIILILRISYRVNLNELSTPKMRGLLMKPIVKNEKIAEKSGFSDSFSNKSDFQVKNDPKSLMETKAENKSRFYKYPNRLKKDKLNSIKMQKISIKSEPDFSCTSLTNSQKFNSIKSKTLSFHNISVTRDNYLKKLSQLRAFKNRKRFTITILFMTIAFFCCQLPIRIFILWSFSYQLRQISNDVNGHPEINYELINMISFIARLIYFLHGISNPLIYNISSSKFRRAFLSLFCLSKRFKKK